MPTVDAGAGETPRAGELAGSAPHRLVAIDRLRGLVIALMAVDHAAMVFNAGHWNLDSVWFARPGSAGPASTPLDLAQYLTRWVTHLCAPTFVFLAGTSVALSVQKRLASGGSGRSVDRHLLARGLFIAALDPLWMSFAMDDAWMRGQPGTLMLQVLYAIGLGLVCAVPLRRLPTRALALGGLAWIACQELVLRALGLFPPSAPSSLLEQLLFVPGFRRDALLGRPLFLIYPLVPWLALLMLGMAFGRWLSARRERGAPEPVRALVLAGLASLAAWLVVEWADGYGNLGMLRTDGEPLRWLQVAKYPPSLAFCLSELGIAALLLAGFFALERRRPSSARGLLTVLGQSSLLFYVLHIHLLLGVGLVLGKVRAYDVGSSWVGGAAVVALLYPACLWFRRHESAHPNGWARWF